MESFKEGTCPALGTVAATLHRLRQVPAPSVSGCAASPCASTGSVSLHLPRCRAVPPLSPLRGRNWVTAYKLHSVAQLGFKSRSGCLSQGGMWSATGSLPSSHLRLRPGL